ncbi:MAG: hypothetical protein UZ07_CHB004000236, partial [Chlorobi bacterium OLB7]
QQAFLAHHAVANMERARVAVVVAKHGRFSGAVQHPNRAGFGEIVVVGFNPEDRDELIVRPPPLDYRPPLLCR